MNDNRGLWRGKSIDEEKTEVEWKYGYYVYQRPRKGAFGQQITNADFEHHFIITKDGYRFEIDPSTLGRYIGLTDVKGNLIFEGDIVKTKYGRLCLVVWFQSPQFIGFDLKPLEDKNPAPTKYDLFDYLEVVGNKFDNPELLQSNKT